MSFASDAVPEASSSAAVATLGSHEARQQIQGVAPLTLDACQHIAVSMHQPRLQRGSPGQVAVGASALPLDDPRGALLVAGGHSI